MGEGLVNRSKLLTAARLAEIQARAEVSADVLVPELLAHCAAQAELLDHARKLMLEACDARCIKPEWITEVTRDLLTDDQRAWLLGGL